MLGIVPIITSHSGNQPIAEGAAPKQCGSARRGEPDTICCVATAVRNGERVAGNTATALAACGSHGFIKSGDGEPCATFLGDLAAAASDLRIINGAGQAIAVPLNADDAYWIKVADPKDMVLTLTDGTARHIPFARPWAH